MRWLAFISLVFFVSCREILPVEQEEITDGYLIKGNVTNQSGTPLENVDVILYYETNWYSDSPSDTNIAVVTDTSKIVTIEVVTLKNIIAKKLFKGKMPLGPIPRYSWNGYYDNGSSAVAGYYLIRYMLDTVVLKESPVVVDGTLIARTDHDGLFIVGNDYLPVGKFFDEYDNQDKYIRTLSIAPTVILELNYGTAQKVGRVNLEKDVVTKVNITM
jgi:hypothetical protein